MEVHLLLAWSVLGTNRYRPDLDPPSVQVWTATHGACDLLSRNPPVLNEDLICFSVKVTPIDDGSQLKRRIVPLKYHLAELTALLDRRMHFE